jgi:hypothetical protein
MRYVRLCYLKTLVVAGALAFVLPGEAWAPDGSPLKAPCTDVQSLREHPLVNLPQKIQSAIRTAVRPSVQTIVDDKAMGLENTKASDVPLNAIQIGEPRRGDLLYAVSWNDSSFGVNGAIWIVEVSPRHANNLVASKGRTNGFGLGGFGVEVFSAHTDAYPEVLIASSGFKDGGGAEAEDTCVAKRGSYYERVPCPATCHKNLNAR